MVIQLGGSIRDYRPTRAAPGDGGSTVSDARRRDRSPSRSSARSPRAAVWSPACALPSVDGDASVERAGSRTRRTRRARYRLAAPCRSGPPAVARGGSSIRRVASLRGPSGPPAIRARQANVTRRSFRRRRSSRGDATRGRRPRRSSVSPSRGPSPSACRSCGAIAPTPGTCRRWRPGMCRIPTGPSPSRRA